MGRTHPQLPRSSDSHWILEGKACQRWLVLMHPHVPCTLIQATWSVVWRPSNFHHNPLWPCLLDLEDSGSWGVRGTWLCFCEIGGRTEQIWLHHMMRKAGGAVGTVSLAHVTWEDGQPLLTPGMELTWTTALSTRHDPIVIFCFPKHCKPKRIRTDLAAFRK